MNLSDSWAVRAYQVYTEWENVQPEWFKKVLEKRADIRAKVKVIILELLDSGELP